MPSPENFSGADDLQTLLNDLNNTLNDLPDEQKSRIEKDLARMQSSLFSLFETVQQPRYLGLDQDQPNNKLHLLLDHLTDAVLIYQVDRDAEDNIIDWYYREANSCALRLLGFPREAFIGKTASAIYGIDVIHRLIPMVEQVLLTGEPCSYEYSHNEKLYSISMFRIDDHTVADIAREITQQRKIEENLHQVNETLAASETGYRELAESINDGFFELDRDWRFTFINHRAAGVVGLAPADLMGKIIWEAFPRLLGTSVEQTYREVMETRKPADFEMPGFYTEKWYTVRVYPSSKGIAIFWIDITQQKQAEAEHQKRTDALRLSEEKFALAFRSSPVAIAISTAAGARFLDVNDSYCELFGFTREELVGHTSIEVGLFPDPEVRQEFARQFAAGKTFRNAEFRLRAKSGEPRDVMFSTEFIKVDGQDCVLTTVVDLTQRKQADAERQKAHEQAVWLARFPDENPNPVARVSNDGTILYHNRASADSCCWNFQAGAKIPLTFVPFLAQAKEQNSIVSQDIEVGEKVYSVSFKPFPNEQYINLYGLDVTERYQAQIALQKSEERFRIMASGTPVMIWVTDKAGGMEFVNQAYEEFFGVTLEQVQSKGWQMLVHPEDDTNYVDKYMVCLRERQPFRAQGRVLRKDGQWRWIDSHGQPRFSETSQFLGMAGSSLDITEQKLLQEQQQEQAIQIELQRRLMDYREQDRSAIARDLHDGPIQSLSSLMFQLQLIKDRYPEPLLHADLSKLGLEIKTTINDLRDTMNDLRPPALIAFGLSKVILKYMEDFQERFPTFEIECDIQDDNKALSDHAKLTLYRIFQGGINNIVHHSGATKIWVSYKIDQDRFYLELRDNGKGFENNFDLTQFSRDGHFGLIGMKERAEAMNAEFLITSNPDNGTTLCVKGPLTRKNK